MTREITLPGRLAALFALTFLLAVPPARAQDLPDGPGKETVVRVCSTCHSTDTFQGRHQDKEAWTDTVSRMIDFGAETTSAERDAVVAYLAANFGPVRTMRPPVATPPADAPSSADDTAVPGATAKINVNKASAKQLQERLKITATDAEAIVAYRTAHGPFKDWHDVATVEGIDDKKIEKMKDQIATSDPVPPQ